MTVKRKKRFRHPTKSKLLAPVRAATTGRGNKTKEIWDYGRGADDNTTGILRILSRPTPVPDYKEEKFHFLNYERERPGIMEYQ